jgi:L-ascorbate metabolism protein UlaG (beta-lactamase superfamily)
MLAVKGGEKSEIYITGDTLYYEGVAEVAKRFDPSYVFIFAGAAHAIGPFNVTMDNNDAIDTALAFPNATIIPLHYDGWSHYTQNEKDIEASYQVIGIDQRLKILEAGVLTDLDV